MQIAGALVAILFYLSLIGGALYGYVHNIITLIGHTGPFALIELVRVVGLVVFPVGIVMGYVG